MPKAATNTLPVVRPPLEAETLRGLAERANDREPGALAELRKRIASKGDWHKPFHDIARTAENALVHRHSHNRDDPADSLLVEEHVRLRLQQIKEELAGPNPTPLEWALAERAALCWFLVNDSLTFSTTAALFNDRGAAEHHDRQQERHHRMYLSSLKALAQVRRLQIPAVQVNIGEKQINMSG